MKCSVVLLMLACSVAYAAKIPVRWTPPILNTDGSALTDLASYRIEWGSCQGTQFSITQANLIVTNPEATSSAIYPTGLSRVCVRMYARNAAGRESDPSNVVIAVVTNLGKPVTLGQPVTLP